MASWSLSPPPPSPPDSQLICVRRSEPGKAVRGRVSGGFSLTQLNDGPTLECSPRLPLCLPVNGYAPPPLWPQLLGPGARVSCVSAQRRLEGVQSCGGAACLGPSWRRSSGFYVKSCESYAADLCLRGGVHAHVHV